MEEWRMVPGYEGFYEVSSLGRIRSVSHRVPASRGGWYFTKSRLVCFYRMKNGYFAFRPSKLGKVGHLLVHRAVAQAFLENPHGKKEVNHLDGDKSNNRVANLEWTTSQENKRHAWDMGLNRMTELTKAKLRKKNGKRVRCVETGETFDSIKMAALSVGRQRECVRDAIHGKNKTAGGYHWEIC